MISVTLNMAWLVLVWVFEKLLICWSNKNISGFIGSSSKQKDIQRAAALWVKMFYWCQTSRPNGAGCFWLNRKETATQKHLLTIMWFDALCTTHQEATAARHCTRGHACQQRPGNSWLTKTGQQRFGKLCRFHESWFLLWHVGSQFWSKQQESIQPLCLASMVQAFRYNVRDVFLAYFGPLSTNWELL